MRLRRSGHVPRVRAAVDAGLPDEFRGWPTRYGWDDVPESSHVNVAPLGEWLERQLRYDARPGLTTLQWLTTPQQLLSEVAAEKSSGTEPVSWSRSGRRSSGIRTTSGAGSSAANGGASTRRSRSSAEPPRSATGSARASWLHVSHETR